MSFSFYITTWNNDPYNQIQDMINKSVLKPNSCVILAFASFNFSSTDYIPGIGNLNLDDLKKLTSLVHSNGAHISLSIGGATYPFYNSDLYNRPGDLANNINILLNKCEFDGVDFDIEDPSNVPAEFATNAASLINTLKGLNPNLNITLTTAAQAWSSTNYQQNLLNLTIGNLDAWQPMEYDLWIDPSSDYYNQIIFDINYYKNVWKVNPNKMIIGLMPGNDDMNHILTLQHALNITSFAKSNNLQGVMIWTANTDSKGCDGNAPYAYSMGIQSCLKKRKLESNAPPPPPFPPTSPELTIDEIKKIKYNFEKLYDLNAAVYFQENVVINDVFSRLRGSSSLQPPDPKSTSWVNIVDSVLGLLVVVSEGNPAVEIIAIITIGTINYLTENTNNPAIAGNKDLMLDVDCSNITGRLEKTYNATNMYHSYMHDDPNTYRDQPFTYNAPSGAKTYTIRDLINIDIPVKESVPFTRYVQLNCRQFRQQITIPEMIKLQFWDIYFVEDNQKDFGYCIEPSRIAYLTNQRSRDFNKENVGVGCRIFANDEIWHYHSDYAHAEGFGNNNDDLNASYLNAMKTFIHQFPAAIVSNWTITNKKCYSFRWYIMEGYDKVGNGSIHYYIANGEFMKWLFIDDGAGNVVNTEGVIYRHDIIRSGVFGYGSYIPADTVVDSGEQIVLSFNEHKFLYPGCNENITTNRVYTEDF
jgi:chitinase